MSNQSLDTSLSLSQNFQVEHVELLPVTFTSIEESETQSSSTSAEINVLKSDLSQKIENLEILITYSELQDESDGRPTRRVMATGLRLTRVASEMCSVAADVQVLVVSSEDEDETEIVENDRRECLTFQSEDGASTITLGRLWYVSDEQDKQIGYEQLQGVVLLNGRVLLLQQSLADQAVRVELQPLSVDVRMKTAATLGVVNRWTDCFSDDVTKHKVLIGIAVASEISRKFDNDKELITSYVEGIVASANQIYARQLNIHLIVDVILIVKCKQAYEVPDIPFDNPRCRYQTSKTQQFNRFKDYITDATDGKSDRASLSSRAVSFDPQAYWHLFDDCYERLSASDSPGSTTSLGTAVPSSLCQQGVNIGLSYLSSGDVAGETFVSFAHEIGHAFGAKHSFEEGIGSTGGVMDYGNGMYNGAYQFNSQYRKQEICEYLEDLKETAACFYEDDRTVFSRIDEDLSFCGNGMVDVEHGEECECPEGVLTCYCCDQCQLKQFAECDPFSNQCCEQNCVFKETNHENLCQLPTYPASKAVTENHEQRDQETEEEESSFRLGYCSNGRCLDDACSLFSSSQFCGIREYNPCLQNCFSPSTGQCTQTNYYYGNDILNRAVDGSKCRLSSGLFGICLQGDCVSDGDGSSGSTFSPTMTFSKYPTSFPSEYPSKAPTNFPTEFPNADPATVFPSSTPTLAPTANPSQLPSNLPTESSIVLDGGLGKDDAGLNPLTIAVFVVLLVLCLGFMLAAVIASLIQERRFKIKQKAEAYQRAHPFAMTNQKAVKKIAELQAFESKEKHELEHEEATWMPPVVVIQSGASTVRNRHSNLSQRSDQRFPHQFIDLRSVSESESSQSSLSINRLMSIVERVAQEAREGFSERMSSLSDHSSFSQMSMLTRRNRELQNDPEAADFEVVPFPTGHSLHPSFSSNEASSMGDSQADGREEADDNEKTEEGFYGMLDAQDVALTVEELEEEEGDI